MSAGSPGGSTTTLIVPELIRARASVWQKAWKREAWNSVRARIEGDVPQIKVWINDQLVTDFKDTANHAANGAADGMLAIQMHFSDPKTPRWVDGGFWRWRVVAVNGRPTPPVGDYWMNFDAGRFGAKFGCNGMGADYRQDGNMIVPGPVVGTRMACPDMSFENDAGVVLSQPLRMMWSGNDRLRLSSGPTRTIDLVRSN